MMGGYLEAFMMRLATGFLTLFLLLFARAARTQVDKPAIITEAGEKLSNGTKKGIVRKQIGAKWDRFADEGLEIYMARDYRGVVPNVRDNPKIPGKLHPVKDGQAALLQWVGFQPFKTYSRVFIKVAGDFEFSLSKERADLISVWIAGARVETPNDRRFLITKAFPTFVRKVVVREEDQGVRVLIYLKKPVGYLYRRDGSYIFVDVEYHE